MRNTFSILDNTAAIKRDENDRFIPVSKSLLAVKPFSFLQVLQEHCVDPPPLPTAVQINGDAFIEWNRQHPFTSLAPPHYSRSLWPHFYDRRFFARYSDRTP